MNVTSVLPRRQIESSELTLGFSLSQPRGNQVLSILPFTFLKFIIFFLLFFYFFLHSHYSSLGPTISNLGHSNNLSALSLFSLLPSLHTAIKSILINDHWLWLQATFSHLNIFNWLPIPTLYVKSIESGLNMPSQPWAHRSICLWHSLYYPSSFLPSCSRHFQGPCFLPLQIIPHFPSPAQDPPPH